MKTNWFFILSHLENILQSILQSVLFTYSMQVCSMKVLRPCGKR